MGTLGMRTETGLSATEIPAFRKHQEAVGDLVEVAVEIAGLVPRRRPVGAMVIEGLVGAGDLPGWGVEEGDAHRGPQRRGKPAVRGTQR